MRTNLSVFLLQLSAIAGLTTIAVAQSDEPSESQVVVVKQESEAVARNSGAASPGILKKFEDWVGLTDSRLEDLAAMAERLQVEIAKMKTQHSQATSAIPNQLPDNPPATPASTAEPASPAAPAPAAPSATARAEIDSSESFDSVAGDSGGETTPLPVLNGSTPDWVKNGLQSRNSKNGPEYSNGTLRLHDTEHSFAISSTLLPELDQCREDLKTRMMSEVFEYLDKHVLEFSQADELPELTQEYVEKYWVKKGQEFDNIQDRPAGTYHQLWIGLHISPEQLTKIHTWEKQSARAERTKKAGIFGGVGVFAITMLSGAVGLLARREKAKLKK